MDFVTHAAVGALVGRAVTRAEGGRPAARAATLGALAALLPDADHVLEWVSAEAYFVHHRTATHSLAFAAAAAVVAAAWPGAARARRAAIVLGAVASHLLLDVATPFGTALLWPFSGRMFALDCLPIVAPWFAGAALIAAFIAAPRLKRAARIGLAVVAALFLGEVVVAWHAARAVPDRAAALAVPDWRNPLVGIAFEQTPQVVMRYAVPPRGPAREVGWVPRGAPLRPTVAPLAARMRLPVTRREGGALVVEDAQFDAILPEGPRPIRIVEDVRGVRVEQVALGVQPALFFAVVAVVIVIGWRRGRPIR